MEGREGRGEGMGGGWLLPGVFVDALHGGRPGGSPLQQAGVAVGGEDDLAGAGGPVRVGKQAVAALLVRQRAAVAAGPREGPCTWGGHGGRGL